MFIGGVKPETTDETIKSYFVAFGAVETVDRPINKQTNENKPFVFVTFKKDGVVGKCIKRRLPKILVSSLIVNFYSNLTGHFKFEGVLDLYLNPAFFK